MAAAISAELLGGHIEVVESAYKLAHCWSKLDESTEAWEADEVGGSQAFAEDAGQMVEVVVAVVVVRLSDAVVERNVDQNKDHSCRWAEAHPNQDRDKGSHSVETSLDSVDNGTLEVYSLVACSLEDEWHPV